MDITPCLNIAMMGCAGYLFGQSTRMDPKLTAIVWTISEITVQIFHRLIRYINKYDLNPWTYTVTRALAGTIASLYLQQVGQISKVVPLLLANTTFFTSTSVFIPNFFDDINLSIRFDSIWG